MNYENEIENRVLGSYEIENDLTWHCDPISKHSYVSVLTKIKDRQQQDEYIDYLKDEGVIE